MLPSKTKPSRSRKSSKGKGKAKASSNKLSAAKKPCRRIDESAVDIFSSQALPLQTSASSNSLEGSSSIQNKVYSLLFDFVLF